jgi:phage gpG-like protein
MAVASVVLYPGALRALLEGPSGPVARDLTRRALRVESRAKALSPVRTGRLRGSITWALGADGLGLFAEVGTNVLYGVFVEIGTRYMSARPYLVPALAAAA